MLVYRLETFDGEGVYSSSARFELSYDHNRHPAPTKDSLLVKNSVEAGILIEDDVSEYNFGFESPDQLRNWFYDDKDLITMHDHEVGISIYEADDVIVGYSQLIFKRNMPKRKEHHNVLEFFGIAV